ncbi:hypothetical protein [Allorhodopirellula solitaria]|uniref:hypothetical protein n=1 Tax=Allorhodopirellula solitaria TaxID=2527987 RepID=UPI0011B667CA|nr:hypothetical protein [Allorhodopirellula solitaria]
MDKNGNKRSSIARATLLIIVVGLVGCKQDTAPETPLGSGDIVEHLNQVALTVGPVPAEAMGGIAHALGSPDRDAKISAMLACGESRNVSQNIRRLILDVAKNDSDPLLRGAALRSLHEMGRPSAELSRLTNQLRNDPELGELAEHLRQANSR